MKWMEVKVRFESKEPLIAEDLISNLFYEFNLQGVVIEQPDNGETSANDWGGDAVLQPEYYSVTGYFPDNELLDKRCSELQSKLDLLKKEDIQIWLEKRNIDEEDWAHSWKTFFKAVKISRRVVVKPTWQEYKAEPGDIVIEIDPGMAFGTGTHPTTSLCIKMIEKYMRSGDNFLDIGTGSGILSITAAKYGANKITGVDIDEVAVEIAGNNLRLNNIKQDFSIKNGTVTEVAGEKFDFVVANITSEILVLCLDEIKTVLKIGSTLILSGIITNNLGDVQTKLKELGISIMDMVVEDDWVAIVCCNVEVMDDVFNL